MINARYTEKKEDIKGDDNKWQYTSILSNSQWTKKDYKFIYSSIRHNIKSVYLIYRYIHTMRKYDKSRVSLLFLYTIVFSGKYRFQSVS